MLYFMLKQDSIPVLSFNYPLSYLSSVKLGRVKVVSGTTVGTCIRLQYMYACIMLTSYSEI